MDEQAKPQAGSDPGSCHMTEMGVTRIYFDIRVAVNRHSAFALGDGPRQVFVLAKTPSARQLSWPLEIYHGELCG